MRQCVQRFLEYPLFGRLPMPFEHRQRFGIAQALMLPLIAGATIYLRRRDNDPRVGPSLLSDVFTWLAFVGITAVASYSVYDLARSLLGGAS